MRGAGMYTPNVRSDGTILIYGDHALVAVRVPGVHSY